MKAGGPRGPPGGLVAPFKDTAGLTGCKPVPRYEQPAANWLRKQEKSSTLSTGGVVELSQLA